MAPNSPRRAKQPNVPPTFAFRREEKPTEDSKWSYRAVTRNQSLGAPGTLMTPTLLRWKIQVKLKGPSPGGQGLAAGDRDGILQGGVRGRPVERRMNNPEAPPLSANPKATFPQKASGQVRDNCESLPVWNPLGWLPGNMAFAF